MICEIFGAQINSHTQLKNSNGFESARRMHNSIFVILIEELFLVEKLPVS